MTERSRFLPNRGKPTPLRSRSNCRKPGCFTWSEWSAALADELAEASRRGEPDDGSRYYHHWLAALERLVDREKSRRAAIPGERERKNGRMLIGALRTGAP